MAATRPLKLPVPDREASPAPPRPSRRVSILLGLSLALVIVGAAWFVGGRQGFDQLGRGGVNLELLPKVGDPAPDVALFLTDGRLVRLSDFRGQPVWLNFWGSWCPPCRAEMPDMQAAYERLRPHGLEIVAVSLDEPLAAAAEYARLNGATYPIAADPQRLATGAAYPIANFPTHVLIDREGVIRDIVLAPLTEDGFVERAQRILAPAQGA